MFDFTNIIIGLVAIIAILAWFGLLPSVPA